MEKINQLPVKYLDQIQTIFSKTPKQVLFEELVEDILGSSKDAQNDPKALIREVGAILREEPWPDPELEGDSKKGKTPPVSSISCIFYEKQYRAVINLF